MPLENFSTFMLSLPDCCKDFSQEGIIEFTLPKKQHICPNCHEYTSRVHDYRKQTITTSESVRTGIKFVYRRRRYRCLNCGKVFSEKNNFISKYQRMPQSDIIGIIQGHSELAPSSAIAKRHGVSPTTAARVFGYVSPISATLDESISIDEFRGNAGTKFQVVINSLTERRCLNVLPDRSPDKLYESMLSYSLDERLKVKHVSIDLSASFKKLAQECFPNAEIAADHFHAVRMANDAADQVRKEVQSKLDVGQKKYFKHSRRLLLKREKDLTEDENHALQAMLNYSDRLSAAYAMKEQYFKMFDSKDGTEFSKKLKDFQKAVEAQDIKGFTTLLKTTIKWKKELIHGIATGFNNGFTEGCNTTIKTIKRIGYGYRNFNNFRRRIMFTLNNDHRRSCRNVCHSEKDLCA